MKRQVSLGSQSKVSTPRRSRFLDLGADPLPFRCLLRSFRCRLSRLSYFAFLASCQWFLRLPRTLRGSKGGESELSLPEEWSESPGSPQPATLPPVSGIQPPSPPFRSVFLPRVDLGLSYPLNLERFSLSSFVLSERGIDMVEDIGGRLVVFCRGGNLLLKSQQSSNAICVDASQ